MQNKRLLFLYFSCLIVICQGCGRSQPSLADYNNTNIQKLRAIYGAFIVAHDLEGPKDEAEFKQYLTQDIGAKVKLKRMGVEQADALSLFNSDRDGKPFKIRYGLRGLGDHPIIFESEGVGGKRMVAFATPREVDADEYEKLWSGVDEPEDEEEQDIRPQVGATRE